MFGVEHAFLRINNLKNISVFLYRRNTFQPINLFLVPCVCARYSVSTAVCNLGFRHEYSQTTFHDACFIDSRLFYQYHDQSICRNCLKVNQSGVIVKKEHVITISNTESYSSGYDISDLALITYYLARLKFKFSYHI